MKKDKDHNPDQNPEQFELEQTMSLRPLSDPDADEPNTYTPSDESVIEFGGRKLGGAPLGRRPRTLASSSSPSSHPSTASAPPKSVVDREPSVAANAAAARSAEFPPPRFVESLLVLGLLALAAYGCWVLYGPLIGAMLKKLFFVVRS